MIYDTVKNLCQERGITIARLEKETGLGNGTVRGWDKYIPSVRTISVVAKYFGVGIETLLTEDSVAEQQSD